MATQVQILLESIERFPQNPGVYLMKNEEGVPLYIGKAVNLKSRVRSYFSDQHTDRPHIAVMLKGLHHIDWIATNSEAEALILEANLIRLHKPRFNIDLKDDKHYPYLKITVDEPFPRLLVVRRVEKDGARYFGPYTDARAMRNLLHYARRIFKIRDCNHHLPLKKNVRPCVNHSIGRCSGACAGLVSEQEYRRSVDLFVKFLQGRRAQCLTELKEHMGRLSGELRFEEAGLIRDQIKLVMDASKLQKVDLADAQFDCDAFGIYKGDRSLCLSVLQIREGLLLSSRQFIIGTQPWDIAESGHENVLLQFYGDRRQDLPPEICLPGDEGFKAALVEQWFSSQFGQAVRVTFPQKGARRALVEMAAKNARLYLMQKKPDTSLDDVHDLQTLLRLQKPPSVIEAFDISNIGEAFAVAGMVRCRDGVLDTSGYRRYKIKTVEGQNDFAMMMEAVTRRLQRQSREQKPFADCLLIDGGPGQLHAAMRALEQFAGAPEVISIAKKEELLYSPYIDAPVRLPPTHPVRRLVERIRDEVHRFAVAYHRHIRGRQFKTSLLRSIPGIGPKKALALLRAFGSLSGVREASAEAIAEVEGFSMSAANKLLSELLRHRKKDNASENFEAETLHSTGIH
jgi:excinuclease ABC subunit C